MAFSSPQIAKLEADAEVFQVHHAALVLRTALEGTNLPFRVSHRLGEDRCLCHEVGAWALKNKIAHQCGQSRCPLSFPVPRDEH